MLEIQLMYDVCKNSVAVNTLNRFDFQCSASKCYCSLEVRIKPEGIMYIFALIFSNFPT